MLIWARLFYWQVIEGDKLATEAVSQSTDIAEVSYPRGNIYSSDGQPLVLSQNKFSLYAWLPEIKNGVGEIASKISDIVLPKRGELNGALENSEKSEDHKAEYIRILSENSSQKWRLLEKEIDNEQKEAIERLKISGLVFEEEDSRFYPEGSQAAQLLGFLGRDNLGKPKGYFGLEGYYDYQLRGYEGIESRLGFLDRVLFLREDNPKKQGRNIHLFIDRTVQFIAEDELARGITRYGANGGWVIIIDAKDGGVIASAALPSYDPADYQQYDPINYKNPIVAETFEPGSIFKPFVMAAALEEKTITPETICEECGGPVQIGEYSVKTWNDKYYPNCTMTEVIQHSDNVGMVWVARKVGVNNLLDLLIKFGFGHKTGIDLEEETALPIKEKGDWYPIDLATLSFGQGIAVTPIQIIRAFSAFTGGGAMFSPRVVSSIEEDGIKSWETKSKASEKVISAETAKMVKEMLVNAVEKGEAKWAKPEGYYIAGKTGTAQIAIKGHYDDKKTIASFIGFAPADDPKFIMLVSLKEPTTSPWGSETAAPLWFSISKRLFYYWAIPPS